jgi:hypothetical protein
MDSQFCSIPGWIFSNFSANPTCTRCCHCWPFSLLMIDAALRNRTSDTPACLAIWRYSLCNHAVIHILTVRLPLPSAAFINVLLPASALLKSVACIILNPTALTPDNSRIPLVATIPGLTSLMTTPSPFRETQVSLASSSTAYISRSLERKYLLGSTPINTRSVNIVRDALPRTSINFPLIRQRLEDMTLILLRKFGSSMNERAGEHQLGRRFELFGLLS